MSLPVSLVSLVETESAFQACRSAQLIVNRLLLILNIVRSHRILGDGGLLIGSFKYGLLQQA